MEKQIKKIMLVLLAPWGIPSLAGEMEPRDAAELCLSRAPDSADKAGLLGADKSVLLNSVNTLQYIQWDRKGHFYTTVRVADYAGISDPARWLTLSYYSEYPDLDSDFNAVPVSAKYFLLPFRWKRRNDITGVLHSLHGGNHEAIEARRRKIGAEISAIVGNPDEDWLSGLLIHAYGDSFAHTRKDFGYSVERAYGPVVGHLFPSLLGSSPDDVKDERRKRKYVEYAKALYTVLETDGANKTGFDTWISGVIATDCSKETCPSFQPPPLSDVDRETTAGIMDHLVKCMEKSARRLSRAEVQIAIDRIKGNSG